MTTVTAEITEIETIYTVTDSDIIRFMDKALIPDDVNDKDTCWLWQGAKHGQGRGYGKFRLNGVQLSAHKASYIIFVGNVEPGLVVNHKCVNENCVNPHHLEAITQSKNILYSVECGTHNSCKKGK